MMVFGGLASLKFSSWASLFACWMDAMHGPGLFLFGGWKQMECTNDIPFLLFFGASGWRGGFLKTWSLVTCTWEF